jgi:soluble lytic murein transglycosylase
MIKKLFLLLSVLVSLNAEIKLQDINSKPACHAKDFMIWQYLQQNITPLQADKAYKQLSKKTDKFLFLYAKKTADEKIKKMVSCKKTKDLLSINDKECLNLAFSPYKTIGLTNEQRVELSKKLDSNKTKMLLKIQSEPFTQKAYRKYPSDTILGFFTATPLNYRRKNLNIYLDSEFINTLSSSWKISKFVKMVVTDNKLNKLQLALLNLDTKNLNAQTIFFLALNHLRHTSTDEAMKLFNISLKKSKKQMDIDKNYFWMYQVTKDKRYLNKLLLSMDINIYTLYAHEILNKGIENFFSYLRSRNITTDKDITDPFDWSSILKEIKNTPDGKLFDLAYSYKQPEMLPVQSFIIQKAYSFKMHGYIMPYDKYLKDLSNDEKALVYAIMRQESYHIPAALSRSFALGLMQLMPFLVDAIAKNCNEKVCYNDMFKPKNNIRYALKHLKWMRRSLYHPLFIAYAYNGGMGFLRRYIQHDKFRHKQYEPFLSMELMANDETREYGKKVLANYVMYKKILGDKVSIVYLFDTLMDPKKTDRFRAPKIK